MTHPVDALKMLWANMPAEVEERMRAICDEPICLECEAYDRKHDSRCPLHPDYDPTSYCRMGHDEANCDCGPIAGNE